LDQKQIKAFSKQLGPKTNKILFKKSKEKILLIKDFSKSLFN